MAIAYETHGIMVTVDQYFDLLEDRLVESQNKIGKRALKAMRAATPKVTGRLDGGYGLIEVTNLNKEVVITNNVEYFDFVNNGTIKMSPRDMTGAGIAAIPADYTLILRNS